MRFSKPAWLLVFALLGLSASSVSTFVHYQLLKDPGFSSFCDVNAAVNCTRAYLSEYGSFLGVPVALGGVIFFALSTILAWIARRSPAAEQREGLIGYIYVLSILALAFVLYLAWASFVKLGTVCVLCLTTYIAVAGLFLVSGSGGGVAISRLLGRLRRDVQAVLKPPALVTALLFLAFATGLVLLFPRHPVDVAQAAQSYPPVTDQERAQLAQWWELQPKVEVPIASDGAKVLIVKFNDYQCPPCRASYYAYSPILEKFIKSGDVKFVLRHFPLETECNTTLKGDLHYSACEAAAAVVMAGPKGTSTALEAWLFAHQGPPPLSRAQIRDAARDVGGVTDYDAQYQKALEAIRPDTTLGGTLGVHSTPTFFINGRRLDQVIQPQFFEALIEFELKRQSGESQTP
ncbi:MAG TPA: vitamin K epoxide reductase family protein [Vicinamibacterales bacterium]|nr:vitamin K epoxide reductase family protein [Vicinamibacterales bacterium]